jgi:phage baseplate assembly protein W
MTNLNEIKYVDWQPKLNEIGEVAQGIDDINQCIYIILTTQKGSVPHRPTFGSDIFKYIDYPVQEAVPNIIREVIDAISEWETRIEIKNVSAEIDVASVKIKIEWNLIDSEITSVTEVIA